MKGIISIGDKTIRCGAVLFGSDAMKFSGNGVMCEGESVLWPIPGLGSRVITAGYPAFKDNVIPVEVGGPLLISGCALSTSLLEAEAN